MMDEVVLLIALAGVAGGALGAKQSGGTAWKGAVVAAIGTIVPVGLLAAFALDSVLVSLAATLLAVAISAAAFGFAGRQTLAIFAGMILVGGVASFLLSSLGMA